MQSPIRKKSFEFAVMIVKLTRKLKETTKDYEIISQLTRCGTSIGANVVEAQSAQSHKDFIAKMSISLKEAYETRYWIELLYEVESLNQEQFDFVLNKVEELIRLLTSIIKTSRANIKKD